MRTLGYWLVRAALLLCVLLALWVVGWRSWTVVVGAFLLSWLIAFASFGSQHDLLGQWVERWLEKRFPPKQAGRGSTRA